MADKLVNCPFNPAHVMIEKSLQRHIIRCMVNYPNFVTCPYNALHRFPNEDILAQHMLTCKSKIKSQMLEIDRRLNGTITETTDVHLDRAREINMKEEDWDKEY